VTYEYETPGKLIEHEPDLDEKMLSRFVYSGRVRLEKSPGVPLAVDELRAWVARRGHPPGYLPYIGINIEDAVRELRRPRPVLVCANKNPPSQNREG
jgi:hypothetical protein